MDNENTASVEIIQITDDHIEGFHQCLDSVARERLYLAFIEAPSLNRISKFVLANIDQDIPQFVAIQGRNVVGWCDISPKSLPGFTHCGELGMGVRKEYRRKGIGRKLLDVTLRKAMAKGLERIELEVFSLNQPAIELYKKLGFIVEGIKKKGRKLDGVYDDVVCMVLLNIPK